MNANDDMITVAMAKVLTEGLTPGGDMFRSTRRDVLDIPFFYYQ